MIVKGTPIAQKIQDQLASIVSVHKLTPHLMIMHAGTNKSSDVYIQRKILVANNLGITVSVQRFEEAQLQDFRQRLLTFNTDPAIHGIIIQLPVYASWPAEELISQVNPHKDVDGFLPYSPFTAPTARGIWEMMREFSRLEGFSTIESFLAGKSIVVLGRGRTAGQPIINLLQKNGFNPTGITSQTSQPNDIISQADIIISAVGQGNIIHGANIRAGCYVIGVGIDAKQIDGEMQITGDIHEEEIALKARLYCPTQNGIGPLTITFLLKNVVDAALRKKEFAL
jgi:5,10-methylene-tetrahydrofolate dehydrogenase/methenyl tetrahydrofolate cyclohydrolase